MLSNQEQKDRKSRIVAVAGTILLHALVCLVLLNLALRTPTTQRGEEGIEVDLSYSGVSDTLQDTIIKTPLQNADSISKAAAKATPTALLPGKLTNTKTGEKAGNTAIRLRTIIETPLARIVNPKLAKPAGNTKPVEKSIQNTTVKNNESARPNQTPPPAGKNVPNKTNGILVQLGNRETVNLAQPAFSPGMEGRIVVTIIVNKEGKVVYASSANRGTTVQDLRVRIQAEDAARKTIFSPDLNAANEQKGTISYTLSKQK